jgi:hypothetical protein
VLTQADDPKDVEQDHPMPRMLSSRRQRRILDCRTGIWGTDKLRTNTNIWRTIVRPDAHGTLNRRAAHWRTTSDNRFLVRRRIGVARRARPYGGADA